ncbi:MAG TPA: DNA-3-methyladenine glycosylase [Candidatus Paceibacterota bacterium]|nr:DNA-3-methyladenine glycosylase [Candidatus Paceibacterota bacterium]
MRRVLGMAFFDRDTVTVARELLGMHLVRRFPDGEERALMITETEAYDGPHDLAAHSAHGRTARTDVLFGPAGNWYVYFIYGMHEMLNIVTGGEGAAVLIRGAGEISGPGRLTKALAITRALNKEAAAPESGLWIEDRGDAVPDAWIAATPRIGVAYAKEWAAKPWRFVRTPPLSADPLLRRDSRRTSDRAARHPARTRNRKSSRGDSTR